MDLNIKTIKTIMKALVIAKESTQIAFSTNQLDCRIKNPEMAGDYLEQQSILIDSIDDYEKLLDQMRELLSRQDYDLKEE